MMKYYFPAPLVLTLTADAVFADWFDDWDTDRDNRLTEQEFDAGYEQDRVYGDWDVDGNDSLRKCELRGSLYESWDAGNDGYLANDERNAGWFDV